MDDESYFPNFGRDVLEVMLMVVDVDSQLVWKNNEVCIEEVATPLLVANFF